MTACGFGPIIVAVFLLQAMAFEGFSADAPASTPTPIAEVRSSEASARDPRVVIRGRVTWVSRGPGVNDYAAVQDDTAGIWIDIDRAQKSGEWRGVADWKNIVPGMLVEVVGTRDDAEQTFAPQIIPESLRQLAPADDIEFPAAPTTTVDRLFSGLDDSQLIRIEGVVQGLREDRGRKLIELEAGGRRFRAMLPPGVEFPDAVALVDATVAATGVATTSYTTRGQFVMPTIFVPRGEDMRIVASPPSTAFEAPEIPLERLGRLVPGIDVRHRVRTRGTVSYASDGRLFYLQAKALGVRVETMNSTPLQPGDVVEVAGFLDRERVLAGRAQAAGIVNAVVRVVGHEDPPAAVAVQPDRIIEINRTGRVVDAGDYDGCLIECRARVAEIRDERWTVLPLIAGDTAISATVSQDVRESIPKLTQGCEVVIRGIVQFELEPPSPGSLPRLARMSLLVPSAADVVVVSRPSWWTPGRLLAALAALASVLAVVLGWVVLLRREVAVQSRRLAAEIAERQRAEIEFDVALRERSRLAGNLHDTVLQTVTGIGYQLKACQRAQEHEIAAAPERLGMAQQMVEHAVDQLRGTVWAMRTMPLEGKSFPAALEALGARLQTDQAARIVVHVAGVEREIPEMISGNLVLLAQEAIRNALQHAKATAIDVMAVFHDDSVGVIVQDNGVGFHAARPPASAPGHFGLEGMRERIRRLGGSIEIESRPGEGTTVTAMAPGGMSSDELAPRTGSSADVGTVV